MGWKFVAILAQVILAQAILAQQIPQIIQTLLNYVYMYICIGIVTLMSLWLRASSLKKIEPRELSSEFRVSHRENIDAVLDCGVAPTRQSVQSWKAYFCPQGECPLLPFSHYKKVSRTRSPWVRTKHLPAQGSTWSHLVLGFELSGVPVTCHHLLFFRSKTPLAAECHLFGNILLH